MSQYENWSTTSNSGEIIVSIEVSGYYGKVAVSQINHLKMFIFAEHSSIMVLHDIHHSVLTIMYLMPAQNILPVLSTVIEKIDLLQRIVGLLSIKIGDVLLPIGDEITEDDMRICDLEQRQKRNSSIKKSIQNSQTLQSIDLQQQAIELLENQLECNISQLTADSPKHMSGSNDDSRLDESKSVSENEGSLQQSLQDSVSETERNLTKNDQKTMSVALQDQLGEGMLSIKPDWDEYTSTIGINSSSGLGSELGDIKDDVTLKEAILTYHHMRGKMLKEAEDLKKQLELERIMRKKSAVELEKMIGFRKIGKMLDESKEVSSTTGTLEERDKDIERMRTEIQRLQESSKHALDTTDKSQRLSMVLQEREEIILTLREKLQKTQKQLTKSTSKSHTLTEDEQMDLNERLLLAAGDGIITQVKDLLQSGAIADYINYRRSTPLHYASSWGHTEVVQILLSNGSSIEAKDIRRSTPLHYASSGGHTEVVQILLSNGSSIEAKDISDSTPLHKASFGGHTEVVQILLSNGASTEAKDRRRSTPLHNASSWGHTEVVQILLSNGSSIEAKDIRRSTPLHYASFGGHTEVVPILLSNGASTEAKNSWLQSPLHVAIGNGFNNVAILLISAKANVFTKDKHGHSPVVMATVLRNEEVIKCLLSNGVEKETIDQYRLSSNWRALYDKYDRRIRYENKTTETKQYVHPHLSQ